LAEQNGCPVGAVEPHSPLIAATIVRYETSACEIVIPYTPCYDTDISPGVGIIYPSPLLRLCQCYPTLPNYVLMTTTTTTTITTTAYYIYNNTPYTTI